MDPLMYKLIFSLVAGGVGFLLGWFLKPSHTQAGDLSMEGEGALRAEADSLRARVQDLEGRLSTRDGEVSELKTQLASASTAAAAPAATTAKVSEDDETYALEWQNRYLAARVKYLESRIAEAPEGAATTAAPAKSKRLPKTKEIAKAKTTAVKKAPAKKAAAKKAPAKKTAAKKSTAKAATAKATTAKKAPAKKAPAKNATSKTDAKFEKYYENVKKYDARASRAVVKNIVDYCGIALKSRDGSLVACSDESELETVANNFVTKKLGVSNNQMDIVKDVCQQMKAQRLKNRVTFYYLAAKKAKKLSVFR